MKVVLILVLFYVYASFEYYWIKRKRIDLSKCQRYHTVPKAMSQKKIIFLSDLQFDHRLLGFDHFGMRNVVKKVNQENPDLVILGGDLIHKSNQYNHIVFEYLAEISAEKIMILGNHDYNDLPTVFKGAEMANIRVLVNETYIWNDIQFVGVADYRVGNPQLPDLKPLYTILLSHNPDYLEKVSQKGIDLSLSGHFHGGQITVFGLYGPAVVGENGQKYRYGFVENENLTAYVSSGVGGKVGLLPIRFFARPEIVILENKISSRRKNSHAL